MSLPGGYERASKMPLLHVYSPAPRTATEREFRGEVRVFRQATVASFNALREDFLDLREHVDQGFTKVDHGFIEMRGKLDAAAPGQQQIVDLIQAFIADQSHDSPARQQPPARLHPTGSRTYLAGPLAFAAAGNVGAHLPKVLGPMRVLVFRALMTSTDRPPAAAFTSVIAVRNSRILNFRSLSGQRLPTNGALINRREVGVAVDQAPLAVDASINVCHTYRHRRRFPLVDFDLTALEANGVGQVTTFE